MLYEIKLSHNAVEGIKNICLAKGEGTVDHCTVIRWFKKFCLGCKFLDNQARSGRYTPSNKSKSNKQHLEGIGQGWYLSPVWLVTLTKASGAAALYSVLPKYC